MNSDIHFHRSLACLSPCLSYAHEAARASPRLLTPDIADLDVVVQVHSTKVLFSHLRAAVPAGPFAETSKSQDCVMPLTEEEVEKGAFQNAARPYFVDLDDLFLFLRRSFITTVQVQFSTGVHLYNFKRAIPSPFYSVDRSADQTLIDFYLSVPVATRTKAYSLSFLAPHLQRLRRSRVRGVVVSVRRDRRRVRVDVVELDDFVDTVACPYTVPVEVESWPACETRATASLPPHLALPQHQQSPFTLMLYAYVAPSNLKGQAVYTFLLQIPRRGR